MWPRVYPQGSCSDPSSLRKGRSVCQGTWWQMLKGYIHKDLVQIRPVLRKRSSVCQGTWWQMLTGYIHKDLVQIHPVCERAGQYVLCQGTWRHGLKGYSKDLVQIRPGAGGESTPRRVFFLFQIIMSSSGQRQGTRWQKLRGVEHVPCSVPSSGRSVGLGTVIVAKIKGSISRLLSRSVQVQDEGAYLVEDTQWQRLRKYIKGLVQIRQGSCSDPSRCRMRERI